MEIIPSQSVAIKVASAIVHAHEALSHGGHEFDVTAFNGLIEDPDVQEWMKHMDSLALLPVKRNVKS